MTKPNSNAGQTDNKRQQASHGNDSKSVTPKDVSHKDAAARDLKTRKTTSGDPDERQEAQLDDAVDLTFPASDPIAIPTPDKEERKGR